jgi:hypothetical protein
VTAKDEFEAFAKGPFDAFMVAHGFARSARAWYLQVDGNWAGLGLQGNRWNDAGHCEFLVNMGVTNRRVDRYYGLCTPRRKPTRFNSSDLLIDLQAQNLGKGAPTWWTVAEAESLFRHVEGDVLPWLLPRLEDRTLATILAANPWADLSQQVAAAVLFQALGDVGARDATIAARLRPLEEASSGQPKRSGDRRDYLKGRLEPIHSSFTPVPESAVQEGRCELRLYDGGDGHEQTPWHDPYVRWRLVGRVLSHRVEGAKNRTARLRLFVERVHRASWGSWQSGTSKRVEFSHPATEGRELLKEHLGGEELEVVYRYPSDEPDPLLFGLPAIGKLDPPPAAEVAEHAHLRLIPAGPAGG